MKQLFPFTLFNIETFRKILLQTIMMQCSLFRQELENIFNTKQFARNTIMFQTVREKTVIKAIQPNFASYLIPTKKRIPHCVQREVTFKKSYWSINRVTISYESWFKIHPWHYVQHFYFPNFKLEVFRIFVVPDLLLQIWVFLCSPILSTRVSVSSFFPIQFINTLEAAIQGCSQGKLFCKYAANLQENTHAEG